MKTRSVLTVIFVVGLTLSGPLSPVRSQSSEKRPFTTNHAALELNVGDTFTFVAFGDARFHDPTDTETANPAVRQALVEAIEKENPAFVSIGRDIVYNGDDSKGWEVWDSETAAWARSKIPIYPALGNTT